MFTKKSSLGFSLSRALLGWWETNKRDFPWRKTKDPYKILMAELLLHRTKASQVSKVYEMMILQYPTLSDLRDFDPDKLRLMLKPLGLVWRTELIIELIEVLSKRYGFQIPDDRESLLSLPGIGDYITSAVRCFAYGHAEVVIDTNTTRVISRIFGIKNHNEQRRNPRVRTKYEGILNRADPESFNYALIDLGALLCSPDNPKCNSCPLKSMCKTGKRSVFDN